MEFQSKVIKTSLIWNHFTIQSADKAKCNYCRKLYTYKGGTTSNLRKHVALIHRTIELKPEKVQRVIQDQAFDVQSPSTSGIQRPVSSPPRKRSKQTHVSNYFTQPCNAEKTRTLNSLLLKMIATDMQPISVVSDKGFKAFTHELNSSYTLPAQKTISKQLIPQAVCNVEENVKGLLQTQNYVSLTTDCWTSRANESYCATTAHFIQNNFTLTSGLLSCKNVMERHTSENLKNHLLNVCEQWEIKNKVVAVTSDNAANIVGAIKQSNFKAVACFAHTLNIVVQKSLTSVSTLQNKIKAIVEHFHRSTLATEQLKEMQKKMNRKILKLLNDVPTRWNSTYLMFQRITEVKKPLQAVMAIMHTPIASISEQEWLLIEEITILLKPFLQATEEISSEKCVTASKIIPMVGALRKALVSATNRSTLTDSLTLSHALIDHIHQRFQYIEQIAILPESTFLDPRFKNKGFVREETLTTVRRRIEKEIEHLIRESNVVQQDEDREEANVVVTNTLWENFDKNSTRSIINPKSKAVRELDLYLLEPLIPRSDNPLKFWERRVLIYPNLSILSKKYLGVMGTSVPSERIFSKTGQIVSERRSRLKPKNVENIIFLNANEQLI